MRFPAFIRATLHRLFCVSAALWSQTETRMRWNTTIASRRAAEKARRRERGKGLEATGHFSLWAEGDGRARCRGHTETQKQSNRWKPAAELQREESESQTRAAGAMRAKRRGWALKMGAVIQSLLLCTLCLQIRGEFHLTLTLQRGIASIWGASEPSLVVCESVASLNQCDAKLSYCWRNSFRVCSLGCVFHKTSLPDKPGLLQLVWHIVSWFGSK